MTALPLSASADAPRDPCAATMRLLWAIDDAIEAWHADRAVESRRIERVWAGAVSL